MVGGLNPGSRDTVGQPMHTVRAVLVPANMWRVGVTLAGLVALLLLARFVLADGGSVIFTLVMAWFLSLAMEPAVAKLSARMRRSVATGLVMAATGVFAVGFLIAFGSLFVDQAVQLLQGLPAVIEALFDWVNRTLGTHYRVSDILASIKLSPDDAARYAQDVLGGLLGLAGSVAGAVFNFFAIILLTFYLSADGPRLRRWLASLMSPQPQRFFLSVWDLSTVKTGGYVAARVVLAAINGATSALVFLIIGMPSWLALGIWTGLVAQFVPTIGTYIAIALPVLVGLASPTPWIGLAALGLGRRVPAGREPHHRAAHQRPRGPPPPGCRLRLGDAWGSAVRRRRCAAGDPRDGHDAGGVRVLRRATACRHRARPGRARSHPGRRRRRRPGG